MPRPRSTILGPAEETPQAAPDARAISLLTRPRKRQPAVKPRTRKRKTLPPV